MRKLLHNIGLENLVFMMASKDFFVVDAGEKFYEKVNWLSIGEDVEFNASTM